MNYKFDVSDKTAYRIKQVFAAIFFIGAIGGLSLWAKYYFEHRNWAFAISISNTAVVFLFRFIPLNGIIGVTKILNYWNAVKTNSDKYIIKKSTSHQDEEDVVLKSSLGNILNTSIEVGVRPNFIVKDSVAYLTTYRSDGFIIILLNIITVLITLNGNIDMSRFVSIKSSWPIDAIDAVNSYKLALELTIISALIGVQIIWWLRTPFLLDVRNKSFIRDAGIV